MNFLELAKRCEQATGPDELLNWEIFGALGNAAHQFGAVVVWQHANGPERLATTESVPRYTASIDAAMTLVPDGWLTHLTEYNQRTWDALLHGPLVNDTRIFASSRTKGNENACKTPALALCAAALRAHAAIADRNPSGGDVKQAPSHSDESGGAEGNRSTPTSQRTNL